MLISISYNSYITDIKEEGYGEEKGKGANEGQGKGNDKLADVDEGEKIDEPIAATKKR